MKLTMLKNKVPMAPTGHVTAVPGTSRIRGYALQVIRNRILTRDCGVCRCDDCKRTGALKLAHEVEHRIPLWAGGAEDDSNRYAINIDCHKAKTKREAAERSRGGLSANRSEPATEA